MTDRQEECLLLLAKMSNNDRCITIAAEELGVKKSTVSNLSTILEKEGYISKGTFGEVKLTELGRAFVEPRLELVRTTEKHLEVEYGVPPNLAESAARRIIVAMGADVLDIINRKAGAGREHPSESQIDDCFGALSMGTYLIPFKLYKKGTKSLSMGDRGFRKPAILARQRDRSDFWLYPLEIQYSASKSLRPNKGTVKRLWYQVKDSWYEMQEIENGGYAIPASAVRCEESPEGHVGRVCVRIRATVSLLKMPESEADLVFYLDQIKQIVEEKEENPQDNKTNGAIVT